MQLIVLARASWRFRRMAWLALYTRGERKFAGTNWCQVSLHCQLRITTTITRGIQAVLSVERQYTAWNGVILGPFYRSILSLIVVYRGKLLSFSTRACIYRTASLLRPARCYAPPPIFGRNYCKGLFYLHYTPPPRGPFEPVCRTAVLHVYACCKCRRVVFVYQACRK